MTDPTQKPVSAWASWPLDREVVIARIVDADCATAFRAWTDPAQIVQWFGPAGFQLKTHKIDIRAGGAWQFDMIAPDGTCYPNRMDFLAIDAPRSLEVNHGSGAVNDPDRFRMLVTFDAQDNGKTVVTLRQLHPTRERRAIVIGFGAVQYGGQTLDKLANHVAGKSRAATTAI
jgi:uncharacterized protein YndB with AHSA1/START domain